MRDDFPDVVGQGRQEDGPRRGVFVEEDRRIRVSGSDGHKEYTNWLVIGRKV